ncbi:MAG: hypothetical protein ACOH2J_06870 [Allorhizobium sp.]
MNAIVIDLPAALRERMEEIARVRNLSLADCYIEMSEAVVRQYDAESRMRARAEKGKGREEEALALLRR